MRAAVWVTMAMLGLLVAACAASTEDTTTIAPSSTVTTAPRLAAAGPTAPPATTATTAAPTTTTSSTTSSAPPTTLSPYARPAWLGTRVLPLRPDDHGEVQPTPPELENRRLETLDLLPPPADDEYAWTIGPVPADVVARSTWRAECPVTLDELAYITMSHWGFDDEFHTGEMIVNAAWAEEIVGVFRKLHEARFPIEQMRVIRMEEVEAPPTGDWNDTTSFVCRPAVGSGNWSRHAYGLAIDVNPFHNPYFKADLVLPELASFYAARDSGQAGVITSGDIVVTAFAEIGWPWGGNWRTMKDYMHFSNNGH